MPSGDSMRITSRCGGSHVVTGPPSGGSVPAGISIPAGTATPPLSAVIAVQTSSGAAGRAISRVTSNARLMSWGSFLFLVIVGCSATTNRCERPPGAAASWYFATRPLTASASSAANAARSAADANRTSLSIPSVASGLPAAPAPVMSSPTSPTSRPATASSQRAERWSGSRDGSGATADRAVGEMT